MLSDTVVSVDAIPISIGTRKQRSVMLTAPEFRTQQAIGWKTPAIRVFVTQTSSGTQNWEGVTMTAQKFNTQQVRQNQVQTISVCNTDFIWNMELGRCDYDCIQVQYSTGQTESDANNQCVCQANFNWNVSTAKCDVDCSKVINATGRTSDTNNQCDCSTNFIWNITLFRCEYNCFLSASTGKLFGNRTDQCECEAGAVWNEEDQECLVDQTNAIIANVVGITFIVSAGVVQVVATVVGRQIGSIWATQTAVAAGNANQIASGVNFV